MNADFLRAVILKVAFKPEPLRRAQAALIYVGLTGEQFTADVLPQEVIQGDTRLAGCATGSLATIGILERSGRCKSPAKSRNGAWVNVWRLPVSKYKTAKTWLARNGFDATIQPLTMKQKELSL